MSKHQLFITAQVGAASARPRVLNCLGELYGYIMCIQAYSYSCLSRLCGHIGLGQSGLIPESRPSSMHVCTYKRTGNGVWE